MARDLLQEFNLKAPQKRDLLQEFNLKQPGPKDDQGQGSMLARFLAKNAPWTAGELPQSVKSASKYADLANKGIEYANIPQIGEGILQAYADVPVSLANFGLKGVNALTGSDLRIPHLDLKQYSNKDTLGSDVARIAGGMLGTGVGGSGVFSKLDKLPRSKGWMGLFQDALKGLGVGYAAGETGDDDEGRLLAGGLGAIAAPLGAVRTPAIARQVIKDKSQAQGVYKKLYNSLFDTAKNEGIEKVASPKIDYEYINKHATKDFKEMLNRFKNNPTLENAHWAQSEMRKFIDALKNTKIRKGGTLPGAKVKALEAAETAQKKLLGTMQDAFMKSGNKDLAKMYADISEGYRRDVGKYLTPKISKVQAGDKGPDFLVEGLRNDEKLARQLGADYPQVGLNKGYEATGNILGKLLKYGSIGGAGAAGFDLFKNGHGE